MTTAPRGFWDDPELISWRRLPMHAVPHRADDPGVRRLDLSGPWAFELFATPQAALDAGGRRPVTTTQLPGLWTMQEFDDVHGVHDLPHYTNVQMPWPDLPPHPPAANPTGVYEREVDVPRDWAGGRVVLHVGAAESVLLVTVDGIDVGVGKDSHLASEFDLTGVLVPGRRGLLRLTVVKWSDATFIEDQDQWWHGGIPRPVFLYATGPVHLAAVRVVADLAADLAAGTLQVDVEVAGPGGAVPAGWTVATRLRGPDGAPVAVRTATGDPVPATTDPGIPAAAVPASGPVDSGPRTERDQLAPGVAMSLVYLHAAGVLSDPAGVAVAEGVRALRRGAGMGRVRLSARVPAVRPWSHEDPVLYDLVVELRNPAAVLVEATSYRVGFRHVETTGSELLINGVAVLLRGVNRHDFHPLTGRVLTETDLRADLETVKAFGFNAVRTSHYPNDPALLDLADSLGLYLIDEADLESHAYAHHVASDPRYLAAFVDRVSRMVRRDVHHPSVILWSLGNESGYGPHHDAAAGWVRAFDPSRPLHYEGAIMFDWTSPATVTDLTCPMYPPIEAIVAHARSGRAVRPLVMCEYSHAMGNSNGTLSDYWEAIESTPGLQGGFIWELWDHGILQRLSDGRPAGARGPLATTPGVAPPGHRWAYGGDFGDQPNDANFIADGLLWPDRTPKPAMYEHRRLASAVRIRLIDADLVASVARVRLANRWWFTSTAALDLTWVVSVDGSRDRSAPVRLDVDLPARSEAEVIVPPGLLADLPADGEIHLRVEAVDGAGRSAGFDEVRLRAEQRDLPARFAGADRATGSDRPSGAVRGDAVATGAREIDPVRLDGDGLIVHPMIAVSPRLALWRAPTDNDRIGGLQACWHEAGLDEVTRTLDDVLLDRARATVRSSYRTAAGTVVAHEQVVVVVQGGGLLVHETAVVPASLPDLPRIGTVFETVPGLDRVTWYGCVRHEGYPDRRLASPVEQLEAVAVDGLFSPYVRPQESGGRHGVRRLSLSGPAGEGGPADPEAARLEVRLDEPRQVSLTRFRAQDLAAAGHHEDLVARPGVVVHLDAAHRGLGTASCGPDTLARYLVGPGTYRWSYLLS